MILTRKELDAHGCDDPNCPHDEHSQLVLVAPCHPKAGLKVTYDKPSGSLLIDCAECDNGLARIAVARWWPEHEKHADSPFKVTQ